VPDAWAVIQQQAAHLSLADSGPNDVWQGKSERKRPEDLPTHRERKRERMEDGADSFVKHLTLTVRLQDVGTVWAASHKPTATIQWHRDRHRWRGATSVRDHGFSPR
jgi:hypothetical protein